MIVRGITRSIVGPWATGSADRTAAVQALFTGGHKGVMYDLTDASNLYQDSARTTLVTAFGDPIGSVTDLSGNAAHASQITTASKPLWQGYGSLDGVDDGWSTAAIDFTTTAAMTVVVGMRALAGGTPLLVELSAAADSNNGAFYLTRPNATGNQLTQLRGTSLARLDSAGYTGDQVTTVQYNIAGATGADEIVTRRNGAALAGTFAAQPAGTGNFGNYALYIGRRGGSTLPFTGHIYRMIVIGRALTASELAKAEQWCAAPAGVTLA